MDDKMVVWWTGLFLASFIYYSFGVGKEEYGPSEIVLKRVEKCLDPGNKEIVFEVKHLRISPTKSCLRGWVTMERDFDDNIQIQSNIFLLDQVGLWKFMWTLPMGKACSRFNDSCVGCFPCPMTKGNHSSDCLSMPKLKSQPNMRYGKYKVVLDYMYNSTKVGCQQLLLDVVPKSTEEH